MAKISFWHIFRRDYSAFIFTLGAICLLPFIPISFIVTPISAFLAIKRVRMIRAAFASSTRVDGVILKKRFHRGEWSVTYQYAYQGTWYTTRNFVLGFKLPFEAGDSVKIALNPDTPAQAFVEKLYTL